jgi:hypothetical protein
VVDGIRAAGRRSIVVAAPPRVSLSATDDLDGTWWPHSLDLPVELPGLILAAAARLDRVVEVSYHPDAWDPTVRHLVAGGRIVRLDGRQAQPADVIVLTGADQQILSLQVIAPDQAEK